MKTVELFAGTGSFSKVAKEFGHSIYRIDNNDKFDCEELNDVMSLTYFSEKDIIWASPPCQCFSVASIGTHWTGGKNAYIPKTDEAQDAILLLSKTIDIISMSNPKYWFIENPRGVMRKVINRLFAMHGMEKPVRHTVTYCQYGDSRMKPTDIWTNFKEWKPRPKCKNGESCHVRAPRGSKTGTQGLKGAKERGVIPPELFREIFKQIEASRSKKNKKICDGYDSGFN